MSSSRSRSRNRNRSSASDVRHQLSSSSSKTDYSHCRRHRVLIDSGAMLHVCPVGFGGNTFVGKKILQLNGAGKHPIANYGQRRCEFITDCTVNNRSKLIGLSCIFQVCKVAEPILSTHQLSTQGWSTVLRQHNSYMFHHPTKVVVPLVKESRSWYLYSHTLYTFNKEGIRAVVDASENSSSSVDPSSSLLSSAVGARRRLNSKTHPGNQYSSSLPSSSAPVAVSVPSQSNDANDDDGDHVDVEVEDVDERLNADPTTPIALPTPKTPPLAERERHEITHIPYASWCAHCTAGKGKDNSHRTLPLKTDSFSLDQVPVVQMDYWFAASQHEPSNVSSILTVCDVNTGYTECCQLPKGNNAGCVAFVNRTLRTLGYTRA